MEVILQAVRTNAGLIPYYIYLTNLSIISLYQIYQFAVVEVPYWIN